MRLEPPEVASDDRWCVRLFGAFRAERGEVSASFRTRKTAGLLAYLAFHAGKPISKDLLVETFWPENNATQGRQSLRMALSSLRSSLALPGWDPDRYLLSDREVVELSEDGITTDVREFLAGIEAARASSGTEKIRLLRDAMTQWSGPFVDGASEPWITPQALELEEFHANALRELTSALCEAGNTTEAAEWAR
ncbi:MAG: BTAD domain-containing putative transcriptional regulator, partial [Fimbriimonadaceae bacterium]